MYDWLMKFKYVYMIYIIYMCDCYLLYDDLCAWYVYEIDEIDMMMIDEVIDWMKYWWWCEFDEWYNYMWMYVCILFVMWFMI